MHRRLGTEGTRTLVFSVPKRDDGPLRFLERLTAIYLDEVSLILYCYGLDLLLNSSSYLMTVEVCSVSHYLLSV